MLKLLLITLLLPLLSLANNNKAKNTNDPYQFLKDHLFFCEVIVNREDKTHTPYKSQGCHVFWSLRSPNSQNIQNLNINDFKIYNKRGIEVKIKKKLILEQRQTKEDPRTFDSYYYVFTENITNEYTRIYFPAVNKNLSLRPESVDRIEPKIKLTREEFMKKYSPQLEKYQKSKEFRNFFKPQFNEKIKVSDFALHKYKDFDLIYINRTAWDDVYCTFSVFFITKEGKIIINRTNANYISLECEEFRAVTKFQYKNNLHYAFSTYSIEHTFKDISLIIFNKKGIPEKSMTVLQ